MRNRMFGENGNYHFSEWPESSMMESAEEPVNCRIDGQYGLKHTERRTLPYPRSYEDIYEDLEDGNVRIRIRVINCSTFEAAKEQLIRYLAGCTAVGLPRVTEHPQLSAKSYDIAYCAADGSTEALSLVRGNTFLAISNCGARKIDLSAIYQGMEEQIRKMNGKSK